MIHRPRDQAGSPSSVAFGLIPVINQLQAIMNEVSALQGRLTPNVVQLRHDRLSEGDEYVDARSWI